MDPKKNIINFDEKRRSRIRKEAKTDKINLTDAPVLDMTERRQEIINHERRQVKRTILTEFIGAFVVVPDRGLVKVAIYDISDDGIAFDIEDSMGQFLVGEEVAMRIYLNHKTYFPFFAKIQNIRILFEESIFRYGGSFLKGGINKEALFHFVKFIETVSASLASDNGDVMVSSLK